MSGYLANLARGAAGLNPPLQTRGAATAQPSAPSAFATGFDGFTPDGRDNTEPDTRVGERLPADSAPPGPERRERPPSPESLPPATVVGQRSDGGWAATESLTEYPTAGSRLGSATPARASAPQDQSRSQRAATAAPQQSRRRGKWDEDSGPPAEAAARAHTTISTTPSQLRAPTPEVPAPAEPPRQPRAAVASGSPPRPERSPADHGASPSAARGTADPQAPRIDVQIGRIEIRVRQPTEPAPARAPERRGFAEYALERNYVRRDR